MSRAKRQIKPPQYLNEYELQEHSQLPKILQKVQKKSTNRLQDITSIVCTNNDQKSIEANQVNFGIEENQKSVNGFKNSKSDQISMFNPKSIFNQKPKSNQKPVNAGNKESDVRFS